MYSGNQIKTGRELISDSQEAWLGYYVLAFATLSVLGGGYLLLHSSGLAGADYWLMLIGVLILTAVCLGICIMCHILGHIVDALEQLHEITASLDAIEGTEKSPLKAGKSGGTR